LPRTVHEARVRRRCSSHTAGEATMNNSVPDADIDMKFEIAVIPVSDVDRAKEFYARLGWRLDADFDSGPEYRVIQFTPPGSGCSVIFGTNSPPPSPVLPRACT
jgi:hypothetical protein